MFLHRDRSLLSCSIPFIRYVKSMAPESLLLYPEIGGHFFHLVEMASASTREIASSQAYEVVGVVIDFDFRPLEARNAIATIITITPMTSGRAIVVRSKPEEEEDDEEEEDVAAVEELTVVDVTVDVEELMPVDVPVEGVVDVTVDVAVDVEELTVVD